MHNAAARSKMPAALTTMTSPSHSTSTAHRNSSSTKAPQGQGAGGLLQKLLGEEGGLRRLLAIPYLHKQFQAGQEACG